MICNIIYFAKLSRVVIISKVKQEKSNRLVKDFFKFNEEKTIIEILDQSN